MFAVGLGESIPTLGYFSVPALSRLFSLLKCGRQEWTSFGGGGAVAEKVLVVVILKLRKVYTLASGDQVKLLLLVPFSPSLTRY